MITNVETFIDRELSWHSESLRTIDGEHLDGLLELRDLVSTLEKLEPREAVRRYFQLKSELENEYYLLFFRLRSSLAGRYQIVIEDPLQRSPGQIETVDLSSRDFRQMLVLAKAKFFEQADQLIPVGDLRCKIEVAKG